MKESVIEKAKRIRKKSKKQAVMMLAAITSVVWLVLLFVKIIVSYYIGDPVELAEIFDGVLDNILGILPPIILIDFAFEAATQDFVSEEMSEQITSALMSNEETIRRFDDEAKRNFLNTTIATLTTHGEREADMAINAIAPYIKSRYNLRKHFDYAITLWDYPENYMLPNEHYMMVTEKLRYEKQYIVSEVLGESFRIGFFAENKDLDLHLRKDEYLFREALTIDPKDLEMLSNLSDQEKIDFVTNEMGLKLRIDRNIPVIQNVVINDLGIDVLLSCDHDRSKDTFFIEIEFGMPQLRQRTTFLVSVSEPTYGVDIRLSYPRNRYTINMFPFFNDLADALVEEADHGIGNCDVHIREKWVYPMSGIVFNIDALSEPEEI